MIQRDERFPEGLEAKGAVGDRKSQMFKLDAGAELAST